MAWGKEEFPPRRGGAPMEIRAISQRSSKPFWSGDDGVEGGRLLALLTSLKFVGIGLWNVIALLAGPIPSTKLPAPMPVTIRKGFPMPKHVFAAAVAAAAIAMPAFAAQTDPDVNKLPAGPEKAVVAEVCTACHELGRIVNGSYDAAGWSNTVHMMVNAGV